MASLLVVAQAAGLVAASRPQSHASLRSITPLPHDSSERQSAAQPSPASVLPSSQISPASSRPLPQPKLMHTPRSQTPGLFATSQAAPSGAPSQAATLACGQHVPRSGTHVVVTGHHRSPHNCCAGVTQATISVTPTMSVIHAAHLPMRPV